MTAHKYNVQCLREIQKSKLFKIELRNKFSVSPYYQKRQSKKGGVACERPGRTHITETKNLKHQINQAQGIEEKHLVKLPKKEDLPPCGQTTFMRQLEDLDFADDINLLSQRQQDAEEKLYRVSEEARKTGLQINIRKTEAIRINNRQADPLKLDQENIKEVDKFVYLGSVVSKDGGTYTDIRCRISKAREYAFNTLRPIWRSTALSVRNKIWFFNTNVKSVLLYGALPRPTAINYNHSSTDAPEASSEFGGLKQPRTKNFGTERSKSPSRQRSESVNRAG
ncbi:hypothetical protein EGW08_012250 [Elysia chlorotica]|uniref:DUF6451 domain-containing protein n=1 Tax=Elysia chlorotica TaxID=188477 RepID=A0A3S1A118_ELYCH|nr:hypothetical protein EGW08_012250 [Elysia chlorotica]